MTGIQIQVILTQSNHTHTSKHHYINLNTISLPSNDVLNILTVNILSSPKNLQPFVDTILGNVSTKQYVLGLVEIRLSPHVFHLYQLPGYKIFTDSRNTHGGGVALYISA